MVLLPSPEPEAQGVVLFSGKMMRGGRQFEPHPSQTFSLRESAGRVNLAGSVLSARAKEKGPDAIRPTHKENPQFSAGKSQLSPIRRR
jgi:hypothetical protein